MEQGSVSTPQDLGWLTELCEKLLRGCEKKSTGGCTLFTPDGVGNYDALWVRDLGYMAEYAGDLLGLQALEDCIRFVIAAQREDGWMPDRVESTGEGVYSAGAKSAPVGEANLDNTPFLVFSVAVWKEMGGDPEKGREFLPALHRGMDCIPLSPRGLVYNPPEKPHSPYGFTDTVCKTGELSMESILYWKACRQMASLIRAWGGEREEDYIRRARQVEENLPTLLDPESGLLLAATGLCRQPDLWASAYGLYEGFPFPQSREVPMRRWFRENQGRYLYLGQVCHLPDGASWEKLLIEIPPGEYQNGAYWATASGWVWAVLRQEDPQGAAALVRAVLDCFATDGVWECVNASYRKLPEFVVSAVNLRGPLLRFQKEEKKV